MSKFKDYLIYREAKRELNGNKTFFEWLQDKIMICKAKNLIKKELKK